MKTVHVTSAPASASFLAWFAALHARHTAQLRFAELRRAIQALSTVYVQRRERLQAGAALASAGKQAAFALFYTPLHVLVLQAILAALGAKPPRALLDLGCGCGAAGLAFALHAGPSAPRLQGVDCHPFAVREAQWNLRALQLRGRVHRGDLLAVPPLPGQSVVAAWTLNELQAEQRAQLVPHLLPARTPAPPQLLVVEPISGAAAPYFVQWQERVLALGGRSDVWEVALPLPPKLAELDHAAGLRHARVKVRSLWLQRGS